MLITFRASGPHPYECGPLVLMVVLFAGVSVRQENH